MQNIKIQPFIYVSLAALIYFFSGAATGNDRLDENKAESKNQNQPSEPTYERFNGWNIQASLAAHFRPEYEGSDKNVLRALPQFFAAYNNRFFVGTESGAGVYAWFLPKTKGWVSIGYQYGRDENDSSHLQGLGDIDSGATLILGTTYLSPIGEFTLRAHQPITGENASDHDIGLYLFAGFQTKLDITEQLFLSPALDVYVTSDDYNDSYFSVNANQSAASGLPMYDASGRLQSIGLRLRLIYDIDQHWRLQSAIIGHRMQGDSADSPVTQEPNQYQAALGIKYTF